MMYRMVGIGEVVWDVFPGFKRIGGAPFNFACHCSQLQGGAGGIVVTGVGRDGPGDEVKAAALAVGMETRYIQEVDGQATGEVYVKVAPGGRPSYEICLNRAWDSLDYTAALASLAAEADAVCFGTLAQRSEQSRETIRKFVEACPEAALRIFDVNLRQDFHSPAIIEESLRSCNILKVNDEELPLLKDIFGLPGGEREQLTELLRIFNLRLIAYTRGARGSLVLSADGVSERPGIPVEVADTVGAGDSFTAAMSLAVRRGWDIDRVNGLASRVAAYVCSREGATPKLPSEFQIELES